MTNEYRQTLCDIDVILNALPDEERDRVPMKLRNFITENKLEDYESNIRTDIPIEEQTLAPETQTFLGMLYLNYWCESEEEKQELINLFAENEKKCQRELNEKYAVFKENNNVPETEFVSNEIGSEENRTERATEPSSNTQMIEYKENIFKRILNKIFGIFRRKEYGK